MFTPQQGPALYAYIAGALGVSILLFFLLQAVPGRFRKPLIAFVTFLAGLFYALEFFWPTGVDGANFLTPYLKPAAQINQVLQGFAIGAGVYSLGLVHLRAIARQRAGWGFSVSLLVALVTIAVAGLWKEYSPGLISRSIYRLCFDGALRSLEAAMFSIIAFYIVSAAYRAFRVRSIESTILLAAAFMVMIGQVPLGQALTAGIPNEGFVGNLRVENGANWVLTRVSSPALLAVELGLGIGALATALRLWLSLERGSYFEREL